MQHFVRDNATLNITFIIIIIIIRIIIIIIIIVCASKSALLTLVWEQNGSGSESC